MFILFCAVALLFSFTSVSGSLQATNDDLKKELFIACGNGDCESAKKILEQNSSLKDERDEQNMTPLMIAGSTGNYDLTKLLLDKKADTKPATPNGRTALFYTVQGQDNTDEIIQQRITNLLLRKKADPNVTYKTDYTPAMYASLKGQKALLDTLNFYKADFNIQNKVNQTALILATITQNTECVEYLLNHGANPNLQDNNGFAPLHIAAQQGHVDMVKLLIAAEANIEQTTKDGCTPLRCALHTHTQEATNKTIPKNKLTISILLIGKGSLVNTQSEDGLTCAMMASLLGDKHILSLLDKSEADFNLRDKHNRTALIFATIYGNDDCAEFLLKHGARHDLQDTNGFAPLHIAAQLGNRTSIELLLKYQADTAQKTNDGSSPLDVARKHKTSEAITLLEKVTPGS